MHLLAFFEELITGHRSSVFPGQPLEFSREQILSIEQKLTAADSLIAQLQEEKAALESANKELQAEIEHLKRKVESGEKPPQPGHWGSQPRIRGRMES